MDSLSPYHHVVDIGKYLEKQYQVVLSYMQGNSDSQNENQTYDNIIEAILVLISKWATGITSSIIQQDVLSQAKNIQSRNHVKPEQSHQQTLHGEIREIGVFKPSDTAVIHIKQPDIELTIRASLHGALLPFLKNNILHTGRIIHFANVRFSNEVVIPNQLCIVDLKKTKSDTDFIIESTKPFTLSGLSEKKPPTALLVTVEKPVKDGVIVSDGASIKTKFYLDNDRLNLRLLLRFGDVLVIYKPDVKELHPGQLDLLFGPNTVIFRVPVGTTSGLSQISQHTRSHLMQDGLFFRYTDACRSIQGTVEKCQNSYVENIWNSTTITLCDHQGHTQRVFIEKYKCTFETSKTIAQLRPNHYIWIFGLVSLRKNETYLEFTQETTIFDANLLYGLISSDIIKVRSLQYINNFDTYVARAIIANVVCKVKRVHNVCHMVINSGHCNNCKTNIDDDFDEEVIMTLDIDDGTCDQVTVYATGNKFPFWGVSGRAWLRYNIRERNDSLTRIIGKEFIFVLSKGSDLEFGEISDNIIWRVDQCVTPVGDVEREIRKLTKWHNKYDADTIEILSSEV